MTFNRRIIERIVIVRFIINNRYFKILNLSILPVSSKSTKSCIPYPCRLSSSEAIFNKLLSFPRSGLLLLCAGVSLRIKLTLAMRPFKVSFDES